MGTQHRHQGAGTCWSLTSSRHGFLPRVYLEIQEVSMGSSIVSIFQRGERRRAEQQKSPPTPIPPPTVENPNQKLPRALSNLGLCLIVCSEVEIRGSPVQSSLRKDWTEVWWDWCLRAAAKPCIGWCFAPHFSVKSKPILLNKKYWKY